MFDIHAAPPGRDGVFKAIRFPSMKQLEDLHPSDKCQEANGPRIAGLEATLGVLSMPQKLPGKP